MEQMARKVTLAEVGFLCGCRYLLDGRDTKFCAAFESVLESVGVKAVLLPPRRPHLNAHLERWKTPKLTDFSHHYTETVFKRHK